MRLILLATFLIAPLAADQEALVARGFSHFYNLEYDEALADFEKAATQDPENPDLHNYVAETILFREMYRVGALESELVTGNNSFLRRPKLNPSAADRAQFLGAISESMELARARLRQDPNGIPAMYALGIAHGLRANYFYLVEKAWREALRDATAGRKLHNRVTELDPSNVDARLMQGLHDYVVGSLPWFYRTLGFLIGFRGDKDKGIRTIEYVAGHGKLNRVDAEIFLCAFYRRERQPRLAIPLLADLVRRFPRNYLLRFEQAQMHSDLGEKESAIACIEKIARLKQARAAGYEKVPWEKVYFQLGTIQFWYNDLDQALENMKKVTSSRHEIDLNTGVLAWMRMGQIYDLTNQRALALEAYRKAIAYAPNAEAARESRRYLSAPYRREKT